ncbi:unnamed protein product [Polarella glacialis]|uniref:Uncharacterized protein n=1 Tax=Polarella glacialis TaxID=89957 RepID=A0A813LHM2_POLGL|nr:unnamed protein product [Polarella glacialis]CAE8726508.1 unnamed protein product [Polarella glacialis]
MPLGARIFLHGNLDSVFGKLPRDPCCCAALVYIHFTELPPSSLGPGSQAHYTLTRWHALCQGEGLSPFHFECKHTANCSGNALAIESSRRHESIVHRKKNEIIPQRKSNKVGNCSASSLRIWLGDRKVEEIGEALPEP